MKAPLPQVLVDVLAKPNPAVIATVRPDGAPVSSAVWYLWDEGDVITGMGRRSPRRRNLEHDPRVAVTVLDEATWYRQVTLHGEVVSLDEDEGLAVMDRISMHYEGTPYQDRREHHAIARIRILDWDQFGFDLAG